MHLISTTDALRAYDKLTVKLKDGSVVEGEYRGYPDRAAKPEQFRVTTTQGFEAFINLGDIVSIILITPFYTDKDEYYHGERFRRHEDAVREAGILSERYQSPYYVIEVPGVGFFVLNVDNFAEYQNRTTTYDGAE